MPVRWDEPYPPYETRAHYAKYLKEQGNSWEAIAIQLSDEFGEYVSRDAVRKPARVLQKFAISQPVVNPVKPTFEDKVEADTDWRSLLGRAKTISDEKAKSTYWQDRAKVTLAVDRPIMVVHSADWHLGSLCIDLDMFREWVEKVLATMYVYLISCGDELEQRGQFKSILPTLHQSLTPHEQKWVLEGLWHDLFDAGKLLCCTWGNHTEEQHEKVWGFSPIEDIKAKDIPYFRGKGNLHLKVGEVEYTYTLNHQNRFNSSFNATHSSRQAARVARDCVDIMVDAHTHNPEIAQGMDEHGRWLAIKCGTFKVDDDFSQRRFKQGVFSAPVVVLHPDCKLAVPFWSLSEAEMYCKGYANDQQTA